MVKNFWRCVFEIERLMIEDHKIWKKKKKKVLLFLDN